MTEEESAVLDAQDAPFAPRAFAPPPTAPRLVAPNAAPLHIEEDSAATALGFGISNVAALEADDDRPAAGGVGRVGAAAAHLSAHHTREDGGLLSRPCHGAGRLTRRWLLRWITEFGGSPTWDA